MLSGSFIYRAGPRRANSCAVGHWTRVAFNESGMNFISKTAIMAEQNKTASPHLGARAPIDQSEKSYLRFLQRIDH
jgi:hypothetical protein